MFGDTITVLHINNDMYSKDTIENVYFEHSEGVANEKLGEKSNNSGTIIIPTEKEVKIIKGDIIIEGNIKENLEENKRLSYFQKKYTTYKVVSVDDLRKGDLPHYEIGVK